MTRFDSLVAVLLLSGCASTAPIIDTIPPPPRVECPAACYSRCEIGAVYAPAPGRALEDMVDQIVHPLLAALDQCEVSRSACVACLSALRDAGAIR